MVGMEKASSTTFDTANTNPNANATATTTRYSGMLESNLETMSTTEAEDSPVAPLPEHDPTEEQRGRLKRRRLSSHSPVRAPSPSRGHDRDSGSRHRHHHRKHHRPSSPSTSLTPPTSGKKHRRRSDAEPDHTLRGRVRNRSGSRGRTYLPLFEDDGSSDELDERSFRKRSAPPSRHRIEDGDEDSEGIRRQRSYPNLYREERRDSKGDGEVTDGVGKAGDDEGKAKLAVPAI